jgi:hypothetical protein
MFSGIFTGITLEIRNVVRRSAMAAVGGFLVLVGVVFLSVAGWIWLASYRDPLFAALVVGGIHVVLGLVLLLMSRRSYRRRDLRAAAAAGATAEHARSGTAAGLAIPLVEAFLAGLLAGSRR